MTTCFSSPYSVVRGRWKRKQTFRLQCLYFGASRCGESVKQKKICQFYIWHRTAVSMAFTEQKVSKNQLRSRHIVLREQKRIRSGWCSIPQSVGCFVETLCSVCLSVLKQPKLFRQPVIKISRVAIRIAMLHLQPLLRYLCSMSNELPAPGLSAHLSSLLSDSPRSI